MGIRCADHVTPLYPQKLTLTLPTRGGRSVGIVRSRTKATEFFIIINNNYNIMSHSLKFLHQNHAYTSPLPHTCLFSVHLILLDSITRIIFGEKDRSKDPSLSRLLHSTVTSFLLGSHILLSTLLWTPSAYVPPSVWETRYHTQRKLQTKL